MQREADDRFDTLELAVMHGVASVMVKGHGEQRRRERARQRVPSAAKPSDGAWARQMAIDFPAAVVMAGPSADGPMALGIIQ